MDNGWSKVPGEEGVVGVVLQEPRARHVPARGHLDRVGRRRRGARRARRVGTMNTHFASWPKGGAQLEIGDSHAPWK